MRNLVNGKETTLELRVEQELGRHDSRPAAPSICFPFAAKRRKSPGQHEHQETNAVDSTHHFFCGETQQTFGSKQKKPLICGASSNHHFRQQRKKLIQSLLDSSALGGIAKQKKSGKQLEVAFEQFTPISGDLHSEH